MLPAPDRALLFTCLAIGSLALLLGLGQLATDWGSSLPVFGRPVNILAAVGNVVAFLIPVTIYRRPAFARVAGTGIALFLLLVIFAHLSLIASIGIRMHETGWLGTPYFYLVLLLWALTAYSWHHFSDKYLVPYHWSLLLFVFVLLAVSYLFPQWPLRFFLLPVGYGLAGLLSLPAAELTPTIVRRPDILDDL